jgi:Protein of unknown function (DUF3606)
MSEETVQVDALSAKRIDINNAAEMSAWSRELAIPEERLREVIDLIGPMTAAIRFYVASPKFKLQH